jgi:hypothetical protein
MPTTIPSITSSTRPGSPSAGDAYFETDTNNYIIYDGANWRGYISDGASGWSGSNTYSLNFDGTDDRLDAISVVTPSATSGTISAWVKTTSTAYQAILSTADTSGGGTWGWMAVYNNKLRITFRQGGGAVKTADGSTTINDGSWHHVVAVSDGSAYSLYVDGSAETLTGSSNDGTWYGDLTNLTSTNIGSHVRTSAGNHFSGNIDELAVWDSALSAPQITNIYKGESDGGSGGTNGTPGNILSFNPKAWWRMGDGIEANSGTTIYDMSSSSYNMTMVSSPTYQSNTP